MNRYKLKMKTLTGLGNEYVYVYATSNFDRYLDIHNLKYARDMTKDYQLTDRFEKLQKENKQLKDRINKAIEYIGNYDVFKAFSFPLMKRDEENQVKSSIQYEFDTSIKKDLLKILKGSDSDV